MTKRRVYLSCDLSVSGPAFAPGVFHHEPGGLSTRQAIDIIQALRRTPGGVDMVTLNGVSAMAAAKRLKEIMGQGLAAENRDGRNCRLTEF